jgi:signal transduction histidine kinase
MHTLLSWVSPPYDLRQAFLVGVLLPLAGLSATVVLVMVNWAERSLEMRLQGEIEFISRAVAPGIGANLHDGRHQEIRHSLESLFAIRPVYGAAVYDDRGERVVAAGIADRDLRSSRAASDVVRTGQQDGSYRNVGGRNVYAYFSPLLDHGGRIHGLLQITRDRREIHASLQELRTLAWSLWFFAVASSLVATLVIYRRMVGRHVIALLDRMKALAAGDRFVTFKTSAPREFMLIGSGFNDMVDSIRSTEEELRERQVHERRLQQQLQESERVAVIGRVAQGLAHELGSPLTVIDGRIRRLERLDEQGRFRQALADVRRQATRMAGIVRQLLNYGQGGTGRRMQVPLHDLLSRILRDVEPDDQRICLAAHSVRATVRGDPVRLELAISNLVRNALRHAHQRVEVGIERAEGGTELYVHDDGEGVADHDRPHIFQPFFTRQPPGSGTGLGLAIVASVMREHDGDVRYQRTPDGSVFVLCFPDEVAEASG